jgi:AraC family transcriptional regulator
LEHDISLAALAASIDLSPYHFARLFKQSTGLTPHQFVIRRRLQKAKELLLAQHAIADVAIRAGFCGQSHLASHFKRWYGVTPRAFQQQMLQSGAI